MAEESNIQWYTKYRKRKFARMDLLDKHAVRDVRELRGAEIREKVIEELKDLTANGKKVPNELIRATIEIVLQKNKMIYTMLARENIADPIRGILNLLSSINENKIKRDRVNLEKIEGQEKYDFYTKVIKKEEEKLKQLLEFNRKLVKILEEYESIS